MKLKTLLEDVFSDQIQVIYDEVLRGKGYQSPSAFDIDALQLGVVYESAFYKTLPEAVAKAMLNLEEDAHFYDDVVDAGRRLSDDPPVNQVTWTGTPGVTYT